MAIKKSYLKRFYKLGGSSSIFWDPSANNSLRKDRGLKVTKNGVTEYNGPMSKRMKLAIKHQHIVEVQEEEALKVIKAIETKAEESTDDTSTDDLESKLNNLSSKKEIIKFYKENYDEIDGDEIKRFSELKRADMIQELLDAEEGSD